MSTWRPIAKTPLWQRFLPAWLHGPAVLMLQISVAGIIGFLGLVFFYFLLATKFDLDEVEKLPQQNTFYDRTGELIQVAGGSGGKMVSRSEIPDFLVEALAAREDARFFEHGGVDFRGLLRATLRNFKDRDFTQGASTLTMQLARNTYDMRAKSLHRKAVEIALTLRIEGRYSKDEILASYLNRIYFGSGAYGIEQAARNYFGKTASQLHPGECAMLVGIIRGPHIFSPLRNFEAAKEQQTQTLDRMVEAGFLTKERAEAVAELEVRMAKEQGRSGGNNSYAMRHVRHELDRILDSMDLQKSGLKVTTTLDNSWQARLELELAQSVARLENKETWEHLGMGNHVPGEEAQYLQYAAVTTQTNTGAVMALIGGRNYGHSRYDRTASRRDLGSAFEPFVAAAAAERGKLVLPGKPIQTGRQIGPAEVERLAKRCGISGPFLATEDLFRGAVAATPFEMAIGLSTLGNDGKKPRPFFIRKISDRDGSVLYQAKSETHAALSAGAAKEAVGVFQSRGANRSFTGATSSERDAWILRLGATGSTAVWLGFDQPKKIADEATLKRLLKACVDGLEG